MDKRKLNRLADILDSVPTKQFDMYIWGDHNECGFAGCAMGWAAHSKRFKGLDATYGLQFTDKDGNIHYSFEAAAACMKLDSNQARYLFSGCWYDKYPVTPKMVSNRIRKFIRENGKIH